MNPPQCDSFTFLCVCSWQTEAFTDRGFSEACQSLTLLLGINMTRADVHSWTGFCALSLPCSPFLSFVFMSLSCIPSTILYFHPIVYKSLYSQCQSLLTHLALDLYDWLLFISIPVSLSVSLSLLGGWPCWLCPVQALETQSNSCFQLIFFPLIRQPWPALLSPTFSPHSNTHC